MHNRIYFLNYICKFQITNTPFTQSLNHSFTHSLIHSFIHSFIYTSETHKGRTILLWFRKTLRLHDNAPLNAAIYYASEYGTVLPVFILDKWTSNPQNIGDVRFEFLMQSLRCLDKNLKAKGMPTGLLFVQGDPTVVLPKIWKSFGVEAMAWDDSEEMEVHDRARDQTIVTLAAKHGIHTMHDRHTHWLHSPQDYASALKGKGAPRTYTSFLALFEKTGPVAEPLPAPDSIPCQLTSDELSQMAKNFLLLDTSSNINIDITIIPSRLRSKTQIKFQGGEDEGLRRFNHLVTQRETWIGQYDKPKTSPTSLDPSTTVLSPYLTHGCLSMRTVWHGIQEVYGRLGGRHTTPPVSLAGESFYFKITSNIYLFVHHWQVGKFLQVFY